jgi:tetratricopeptide (TPR) repeat protein
VRTLPDSLAPMRYARRLAFFVAVAFCLTTPGSPSQAHTASDYFCSAAPGLNAAGLADLDYKPFFEEQELLTPSAVAKLATTQTPADRARLLVTQGLVDHAFEELQPVATSTSDDDLIVRAIVLQHLGRFSEAQAELAQASEKFRTKQSDWLALLEAGRREIAATVKPQIAALQANPRNASAWAALSRAWLSPALQVRRNALAAATVARALAPESSEARTAEAEALAAYAFAEWTQRATCPLPEYIARRAGNSEPPPPLQRRFDERLSEEPADSFVGRLRAIHLLARQPGELQESGARLELDALARSRSTDSRLEGVRLALQVLCAEKAGLAAEHYRALSVRVADREFLSPIRIGCRPPMLLLGDLLKPSGSDHTEAIEDLASTAAPKAGSPVCWAAWRLVAEGIAASRLTLGSLPPGALLNALEHLDAILRSQDPDAAALGALGRAWFAYYELYSADEYTEARKEFLSRALSRLQDSVANGGPTADRLALALAYRAAGNEKNAREQMAALALVHNPVLKSPTDAAADWLRVGLTCLEVEASVESEERAARCFKQADQLIGADPQLADLVTACRALAGTATREETDAVLARGACIDKLPPLGAEIAVRLHQRETARAYFELACGFPPSRHLLNYESSLSDRGRFARMTLPTIAASLEERLAAPEGFPRKRLVPTELRAVVDRAFLAPTQLQQQVLDLRAALRKRKTRDWNDRALDLVLANALPSTDFLVETLHRSLASAAAKKAFDATFDNNAFANGLIPVLRLVDPDGTPRPLRPLVQTEKSWEDFLVSLTVGYLNWAGAQRSPYLFVLGVDEVSLVAVEALKLRPDRATELRAAATRYDAKGRTIREEVVAELARKREQERVAAEERERLAAQERAEREERKRNPYIIAGLDFTPPEPPPRPEPVYTNWESNEPEQITCSTCGGTGTTRTTTSWSNSALQTCWRCKGKGTRSPHAM